MSMAIQRNGFFICDLHPNGEPFKTSYENEHDR